MEANQAHRILSTPRFLAKMNDFSQFQEVLGFVEGLAHVTKLHKDISHQMNVDCDIRNGIR